MTDRGRRVVVLAQENARMLNHNYIGTEHILLGLIREGEGVGAQVLVKLGANLPTVRQAVIEILGGVTASKPPNPGPDVDAAITQVIIKLNEASAILGTLLRT